MHSYRTTFSASPEIAKELKEIARTQGKSVSAVVSELLATALGKNEPSSQERLRFTVRPYSLELRPGFDPMRLGEILSDLEVEER
jgi:Ribbon-helix-helix protein, copG family